jgi:hypothetical protein
MSLRFSFRPVLRPRPAAPVAPPALAAGAGMTGQEDEVGLIYRLRCWPPLPAQCRTSRVFRVLALMSQTPVSQQWLLARSGLAPLQVDELILNLVVQRAVDVSDGAGPARRH